MDKIQLVKLQGLSHDLAIELRAEHRNDRILASSKTLARVCELLEYTIKACLKSESNV